jgi:shikimate kinase
MKVTKRLNMETMDTEEVTNKEVDISKEEIISREEETEDIEEEEGIIKAMEGISKKEVSMEEGIKSINRNKKEMKSLSKRSRKKMRTERVG